MIFGLNLDSSRNIVTLKREILLKPLQTVAGVIEKKQALPILGNVVLSVEEEALKILGSDSEIEIRSTANLEHEVKHFPTFTISGHKLLDICRNLPDGCEVTINATDPSRIIISTNNNKFTMATLPAESFPIIPPQTSIVEFFIGQRALKGLITKTYFAIPQQNIRNYLSGLLIEIDGNTVKAVASDGHRLATNTVVFGNENKTFAQTIIPRKTASELTRLLEDNDDFVIVGLNNNYIKVTGKDFVFISKLLAGRFPNYNNLIPKKGNKTVVVERAALKQALVRVSVLSNEISHNVYLSLENNMLRMFAKNSENEEANEEININYNGDKLDIIVSINYLMDVLNNTDCELIEMTFKDSENGVIIKSMDKDQGESLFVLMPVRR
jgi:DNA polymerase III subunit beta